MWICSDVGWKKLFEKYGPVVSVNILGNHVIGTNSPLVAEQFLKENEYFTKKVNSAPTASCCKS